jgi:hypothetical protein
MPLLRGIRVGIIDGQDPNEHAGHCIGAACDARMPSQDTEPRGDVAQELLVARGCKFRYPVVLSPRRRGPGQQLQSDCCRPERPSFRDLHGGHLSHRQNHRAETHQATHVGIDHAPRATVGQAKRTSTGAQEVRIGRSVARTSRDSHQYRFPGAHEHRGETQHG